MKSLVIATALFLVGTACGAEPVTNNLMYSDLSSDYKVSAVTTVDLLHLDERLKLVETKLDVLTRSLEPKSEIHGYLDTKPGVHVVEGDVVPEPYTMPSPISVPAIWFGSQTAEVKR